MKPRIAYLKLAETVAPDYVRTGFWIDSGGILRGWNEYSGPSDRTAVQQRDSHDASWRVLPGEEGLWPGFEAMERDLRAKPYQEVGP